MGAKLPITRHWWSPCWSALLLAGCAGNRPAATPTETALAPPAARRADAESIRTGSKKSLSPVRLVANEEVAADAAIPGPLPPQPATADGAKLPKNDSPEGETTGSATLDRPIVQTFPLDLSTALELTAGQNPEVAFARARIQEAQAQVDRADVLWLPSIRAGVNFNHHEGQIQNVDGTVTDVSRSLFFTGLGGNMQAAASPTLPGLYANFQLADALFQPRIATAFASARRFESQSVRNDSLLQTAVAYLDLLRAEQETAIARETLENARALVELTGSYARTGEGLASDYDRARTEVSLRTNDVIRGEESAAVASARLAAQLHVDPSCRLQPAESTVAPIRLIDPAQPLQNLVADGLAARPEVSENRALVAAACERLKREKFAPLVPSVLLGVSYGGFGGGVGDTVGNFGPRFDADAVAYWEIRNLGLGELAARAEAGSRVDQARFREIAALDRVAREVVEAHAAVESRRRQIDVAQEGIAAAVGSYRRNLDRIRNAQGLPIEVLQSIQALAAARREYLRAVSDYNTAQFQLYRSIGWPSG